MSPGRGPTPIKKKKGGRDLCNAAVRVFSDGHSENSSLAGSEKGCEKLKKTAAKYKNRARWRQKARGATLKRGERKKKCCLSGGNREQEQLLLPFVSEFVSEKRKKKHPAGRARGVLL